MEGFKGLNETCVIFNQLEKAIDYAMWINFSYRKQNVQPFYVISGPDNNYAVVSDDILDEHFPESVTHPLNENYLKLSYEEIRELAKDRNPLKHWEELCGAFSTMDGELLRYILHMKIPLEKLIRYELAKRGYDESHHWCGFERADQIWLK